MNHHRHHHHHHLGLVSYQLSLFFSPPPPPPRLVRPTLIARNGQYVTGSALGEVRLREVDLGLHDDRALPPVHAALDGTGDVDLQLPLLAAEETIKDGGQRDRETERERDWLLAVGNIYRYNQSLLINSYYCVPQWLHITFSHSLMRRNKI